MDRLFEKMWTYVRHGADISLEIRFFRLICLTISFVCLFLVLPANLVQDLSPYLNLATALYGLALFYLYLRSRNGCHHVVWLYLLSLVELTVAWFLNAGSQGSIGYYFFALILYPLIFFRGRTRQLMVLLLVAQFCVLLVLEYLFPRLVLPYHSALDRLLDLGSGFAFSALVSSLVFWVVITTLERELEERRRAEVSLLKERDRAQGYLDTVETLIVALDAAGRISTVNRKACEVLGYREEELLGRDWFDTCLPQPLAGERAQVFADMVAGGASAPVAHRESPVLTRGGELRHVVWHYSFLFEEKGRCSGALASGEDITERKNAEQALRDSEQALRLKTALLEAQSEAILDGVLMVDKDQQVAFYNRRFVEIFQVPDAVLADPDDATLLRHALGLLKDPDRFLKRVLYLYGNAHEASRDQIEMKNGTILDRYSAPVVSVDGLCYGRIWTFRDVTEQKVYETERLKIEKLESLGVLAGGIAHDFNNILAGIMGGISFAQEFVEPSHQAHKPLATAEQASVRAAELARQLITFARGGDLVKKVVSVKRLVEEEVSFALRGSNVRGDLELQESLHAIKADEGQMNQALYNLIINAKQAMPRGGTVTISARNETLPDGNLYGLPAGDYVKISCSDQGGGIAETDLPKVFDPYFTTKSSGTGLGLASVYSIVKKHAGNVSVSSVAGSGATFTLYLPAAREKSEPREEPPVEPRVAPLFPASILVMDDEAMVRDLAREMLTHVGYRVTTCENGSQAVSLYQGAQESGAPFDAVIMDLTIPGGMGGKEAAERILALHPGACLVVSSGYSDDPIMADYAAYGFRGAVAKPYKNRELWRLLSAVLGSTP